MGVHFAGKNNQAEAVQNVEDQEREAIQEVQPESESAPVTEVEAPANAYGLTAEDLKVLENIYRSGEGGRTEEVAKSAQPEFVRLYPRSGHIVRREKSDRYCGGPGNDLKSFQRPDGGHRPIYGGGTYRLIPERSAGREFDIIQTHLL